jgi:hypothetical protein
MAILAGFLSIMILFPIIMSAQGNLLVTPKRIVFDGTKRTFDINLANIGQDTAVYAISLVQVRMKEDGSFETITTPDEGQNFADKNLRFFPRSVTLPPNDAQVVKVQLLRINQLSPGEYRSHFYFRSVPKIKPLGEEDKIIDSTAISVRLTPIFGITIPAIIRIGESTTELRLSDLSLNVSEDDTPVFRLKFNRSGNFSAYGDLAVDHVSPQGIITRVGAANGIAVYTPNTTRYFQFNLNKVAGVDLTSGTLRATFSAPSDVRPLRYAEAELLLN